MVSPVSGTRPVGLYRRSDCAVEDTDRRRFGGLAFDTAAIARLAASGSCLQFRRVGRGIGKQAGGPKGVLSESPCRSRGTRREK